MSWADQWTVFWSSCLVALKAARTVFLRVGNPRCVCVPALFLSIMFDFCSSLGIFADVDEGTIRT